MRKSRALLLALIWVCPRDPCSFARAGIAGKCSGDGTLTRYSPGTTNSAVAIMEGKVPKIIENAEGL